MWAEIIGGVISQTVQDLDAVKTAEGASYPGTWPKETIPNFVAVILAAQAPAGETVTGSTVVLVNGVPTQTLTTAAIPLATAQAAQEAVINAAAQADLAVIVASYPALEVATWDQQYAEAVAWTANNAASTPTLSAIATAAGSTVAVLAPIVIAKAAAYKAASGAIIGKKQALLAKIATATTVAAVQAVTW
ncbi:MAG: hypothetical protein B7W99_01870 [Rhodospirillales bacterium 20-58-10]|nr:MAG: hypothetical protein B7W99_01870 [Rhodospirillales bacterium 20-58-10]